MIPGLAALGVSLALATAFQAPAPPDASALAPVEAGSDRTGAPDTVIQGSEESVGVAPGDGAGIDTPAGLDADARVDADTDVRDDPDGGTETTPASLPPVAPAAPASTEPRANGGAYDAPLPPAPAPKDPAGLTDDPWRGRFWLGIALHLSIPVGGTRPGAGTVVAPVPEVAFGWRVRPWLGLQTSLSNFSHDAAITQELDAEGREIQEVFYGRITAFDLLTARFYWPRPRRVEPWAEVGAGVGVRRSPLDAPLEAAGLVRVGMGVDFWLAPTFSLRPEVGYRLNIIDKTVGHGLRAGLSLGVHW
ncbi:MAG: hypothetical protein AAGF11_45970 [Myxococcota bacterium]